MTVIRNKGLFEANDFFKKNATVNSEDIYQDGKKYLSFWEKCAEDLSWYKKWDKLNIWKSPDVKWFVNGKINACYNCIDRHIENNKGDKIAFYWEGENGTRKKYTYQDLYNDVNKFANALKAVGIKKHDKVAIYLPMIYEAIVSMMACARIGAIHVVIFGGIGPDGVKDRIVHSDAKIIITSDGAYRRGKILSYKKVVDEAIKDVDQITDVIVVKNCNNEIYFNDRRDHWFHEVIENVDNVCPCEKMDSEDMLFILYTSGSTGKPKGIYHSTAGYLLGVHETTKWVFDIKQSDIYWCTADIGWITGHSYVVYGLLSNCATQVIYEGSLDFPEKNRAWEIIEKYGVNIFYTAPTAIRMFMKWGDNSIGKNDISSLRLLGSIGEPINPEVWLWYYEKIGNKKCPIVDTWFQTETGALVISPLPGISKMKPGSINYALPGFAAKVLNEDGEEVKKGFLALTQPYPSMLRGMYKDEKRFKDIYWSKWGGEYYYSGDGAMIDDDGNITVIGRLDDVMKISGHRIGTAEVESALIKHPLAAEASVVSVHDDIKGEKIIAFVILKEDGFYNDDEKIKEELKNQVKLSIGSYAKPDKVFLVKELPKTKSGKIMRRILKDLINNNKINDVSTLENIESINILKQEISKALI